VARHGPEAVAAYGVGTRLESLALLVVLALSTSLPPFISQNLGAGRIDRVIAALRIAVLFTLAWELAIYFALLASRPAIVALYTKERAVAEVLALLLAVVPLSYGMQGVVVLSSSSFNALHEPRHALVLSVLRWFGLYVPCAVIGAQLDGLRGLFAGAVMGNLCAGALAWRWLSRHCARLAAEGGRGVAVARPGGRGPRSAG
jgi:Na+-driven multidrug efflux pump